MVGVLISEFQSSEEDRKTIVGEVKTALAKYTRSWALSEEEMMKLIRHLGSVAEGFVSSDGTKLFGSDPEDLQEDPEVAMSELDIERELENLELQQTSLVAKANRLREERVLLDEKIKVLDTQRDRNQEKIRAHSAWSGCKAGILLHAEQDGSNQKQPQSQPVDSGSEPRKVHSLEPIPSRQESVPVKPKEAIGVSVGLQ